MTNISKLREELQGPRRPYDTFYGRYVMRFFSIYITAFLLRLPVKPTHVTSLSVVLGIFGTWLISRGEWGWGFLYVNLWYLLDHVDGEMSRYKKTNSTAGLFADTIANPIIFPLFYFGMGAALAKAGPSLMMVYIGALAAYGSMMMVVIPFCEETVILSRLRQGKIKLSSDVMGDKPNLRPAALSLRSIFSAMHKCTSFPVNLLFLTVFILISSLPDLRHLQWQALEMYLWCYASLVTLVWVMKIVWMVSNKKLDTLYPPIT